MFGTNYFENNRDVLSVGYNQGEMIELFTSHIVTAVICQSGYFIRIPPASLNPSYADGALLQNTALWAKTKCIESKKYS